jgi:hypothetical protein
MVWLSAPMRAVWPLAAAWTMALHPTLPVTFGDGDD